MAQKIQFRRDTLVNFTSNNVVLSMGEPAYTTDDKDYRVGDGVSEFSALPVLAKRSEVTAVLGVVDAASNNAANALVVANNVQETLSLLNVEVNNNVVSVGAIDGRVTALEALPVLTVIDGGNAVGN